MEISKSQLKTLIEEEKLKLTQHLNKIDEAEEIIDTEIKVEVDTSLEKIIKDAVADLENLQKQLQKASQDINEQDPKFMDLFSAVYAALKEYQNNE